MNDVNDLPVLADVELDTVDEEEPEEDEGVSDDVEAYYWKLKSFVRMVARGEHDSLLIEAPPGLGKTYQINRTLRDEVGTDGYRHISGYITPVELYHAIYDTREGKVLFLDDVRGVVSNKNAMSILKSATWSDNGMRTVEWRSTSGKVEAPEKFRYSGRIIMCFNEVPDNEIFESLKNRSLPYRMDFTYEERMNLIHEIAKYPYKDLELEEREEVAKWIEENTIPGSKVSLRVLFHVMDCRVFEPDRWRELASDFTSADEEIMLVRRLLDECSTVEEAAEEYGSTTGKTRRTFFRKKKQIADSEGRMGD